MTSGTLWHGQAGGGGVSGGVAMERNVSVATQTQALSALLFFYREVLGIQLPCLDEGRVLRAVKKVAEAASIVKMGCLTRFAIRLPRRVEGF